MDKVGDCFGTSLLPDQNPPIPRGKSGLGNVSPNPADHAAPPDGVSQRLQPDGAPGLACGARERRASGKP